MAPRPRSAHSWVRAEGAPQGQAGQAEHTQLPGAALTAAVRAISE